MIEIYNHIIEKVFVEINTKNSEKAFSIRENVSGFINDTLFPQIEKLFDEIDTGGEILRIEKMEVSSDNSVVLLNEEVVSDIVVKIESGLRDAAVTNSSNGEKNGFNVAGIKISNQQLITNDINDELIFLNFIQSGEVPWFADNAKMKNILADENWLRMITNQNFCDKLRKLLIENKTNLLRFVKQIPLNNMLEFVSRLFPELKSKSNSIKGIHNQLSVKEQFVFLQTTLQILFEIENQKRRRYIAGEFIQTAQRFIEISGYEGKSLVDRDFEAFIQSELIRITILKRDKKKLFIKKTQNNNLVLSDRKEDAIEFYREKPKQESQLIHNAGLVLLHPFLKNFLINTRIAESSGKIEDKNLELAVQAFHFIATGHESEFEAELVFEKFLCGLPVHYPIIRESLLTAELRSEAEEMLTQVIKQWPALKNTSPKGLRESFIQRNGILVETEKGYNLSVEANSWDILLDRLPWNYSIISWYLIDKLIFVEWQR